VIVFLIAYNVKGLVASGDDINVEQEASTNVNPLHDDDETGGDDDRGEQEQD
jgi:hypothetical protein